MAEQRRKRSRSIPTSANPSLSNLRLLDLGCWPSAYERKADIFRRRLHDLEIRVKTYTTLLQGLHRFADTSSQLAIQNALASVLTPLGLVNSSYNSTTADTFRISIVRFHQRWPPIPFHLDSVAPLPFLIPSRKRRPSLSHPLLETPSRTVMTAMLTTYSAIWGKEAGSRCFAE